MAVRLVLFSVNEILHILENRDLAWNSNGALLFKSVFFLGLLKQLLEERVVDVYHRYNESALLFALSNVNGEAALGHILVKLLSFPETQMQRKVREVQ